MAKANHIFCLLVDQDLWKPGKKIAYYMKCFYIYLFLIRILADLLR